MNRLREESHRAAGATLRLRCRHVSLRFARFAVSLCLLLPAATSVASDFNPTNAPFDELFFHAQRYGNTPERRLRKEAAHSELLRRKGESLKYLMQGVHTENIYYGMYAEHVMNCMETNDIAAVLLPFLKSDRKEARRMAVYHLGLRYTPEHTHLVTPFLDDEEAAGAAIRTLGKWQASNSVERIASFLGDSKERRRVMAANALGDIRDPRAVPYLVRALGDPVFTVRRAAARALTFLGSTAERELIVALKGTDSTVRREASQALGTMKSRDAVPPLRVLLEDPDPGTRADAVLALSAIDPKQAPDWIKGTQAAGIITPDGFLRNDAAPRVPQ